MNDFKWTPLPAMAGYGSDEVRFFRYFDISGSCWTWGAGKDKDGYGVFSAGSRWWRAHRWIYELLVGPIPAGLQIDHLCRNPSCVNTQHMEAVTGRTNTARGASPAARNASKTRCKRGHPLAGDNLRTVQGRYGEQRVCIACARRGDARNKRRSRFLERFNAATQEPK